MKVKKRYSGVLKHLVGKLILEKKTLGNGLGYYIFYVPVQQISPTLTIQESFIKWICLASVYNNNYTYFYKEYNRKLKILFNLGLKKRIDEIFYGQETI